MSRDISESDWKIIRDLNDVLVERFYDRTMAETAAIMGRRKTTARQRFHDSLALLKERRKQAANLFDGLSRSNALFHIAAASKHELLTDAELSSFSPGTRERVAREISFATPREINDDSPGGV